MRVDHDSVWNGDDVCEQIRVAQDVDGCTCVKKELPAIDGGQAGTRGGRNCIERVLSACLNEFVMSPGGNEKEPLPWGAKVQPPVGVLEGGVPDGAGVLAKEG